MLFARNGITRKQWWRLHFGVLILGLIGFCLLALTFNAHEPALIWLCLSACVFVNLPGKNAIRETPNCKGWRGREPWFALGDRVRPTGPLLEGIRPLCTVTLITKHGFEFTHEPISLGHPPFGKMCGGEAFDPTCFEFEND